MSGAGVNGSVQDVFDIVTVYWIRYFCRIEWRTNLLNVSGRDGANIRSRDGNVACASCADTPLPTPYSKHYRRGKAL